MIDVVGARVNTLCNIRPYIYTVQRFTDECFICNIGSRIHRAVPSNIAHRAFNRAPISLNTNSTKVIHAQKSGE